MKYVILAALILTGCANNTPRYGKCLAYCEDLGLTCRGAAKNGKFVCGPNPTDTRFPKN